MPLITRRALLSPSAALRPLLDPAAFLASLGSDAGLSTISRASHLPTTHTVACGCAACSSSRAEVSVSQGMHICSQDCTCSRQQAAQAWGSSTAVRAYSAAAKEGGEESKPEREKAGEEKKEGGEEGSQEGAQGEELNVEELLEKLKKTESAAETTAEQVSQLTDSLKRSLAEMENLRMRTSREVENAKKFAIQSFLKNILDVADNLERAYGAVPADALSEEEGKALDAAKLRSLLKGMMGGVATTEKVFLQALKQEGVQQYNPEGEKFDPHYHSALFEMVDPSKEPGQVGQVTKRGYTLHDRVIRPAEVGVVRAEEK